MFYKSSLYHIVWHILLPIIGETSSSWCKSRFLNAIPQPHSMEPKVVERAEKCGSQSILSLGQNSFQVPQATSWAASIPNCVQSNRVFQVTRALSVIQHMYNQNYYGSRESSIFFLMRDAQYKCTYCQYSTTAGHSQWMVLSSDEVSFIFSKNILLNQLRIECLHDTFFSKFKITW